MKTTKKICSSCKKKKSTDKFVADATRVDGLFSYCKECHAQRSRDFRDKNPEYYTEYHKQYRETDKEKQKERLKAWRKANPDYAKNYYHKNKKQK